MSNFHAADRWHTLRIALFDDAVSIRVNTEDAMKRTFVRELLGVTLVLHGLANAVMPMRAMEAGLPDPWRVVAIAVYQLAILGFVVAGLGLLRVAPLWEWAVPAVWIGGLSGLIAHTLKPDGDLWAGILLSATLPIFTSFVVLTEPAVPSSGRTHPVAWRRLGALVGGAVLIWITAATVTWPWSRGWGATSEEWAMALPGDPVPRTPEFEILHAVTINAPPERVWAWLVQLGQDRAGFYSYDWLERLFGADIHNVNEIRPEWQTRAAGDRVFATQPGYMRRILTERPGWRVLQAEPHRALVLENWGAFVLVPRADGSTRLLIRSTISHARIPAWAAALNLAAFELPHFIMQRKMLLTLKARSERPTT